MKMLYVFNETFDKNEKLIISWNNGLKVKGSSLTGVYETDTELGEDGYIGDYAATVNEIQVLRNGRDHSIEIYNDSIEISLACIPNRITTEEGRVLWQSLP